MASGRTRSPHNVHHSPWGLPLSPSFTSAPSLIRPLKPHKSCCSQTSHTLCLGPWHLPSLCLHCSLPSSPSQCGVTITHLQHPLHSNIPYLLFSASNALYTYIFFSSLSHSAILKVQRGHRFFYFSYVSPVFLSADSKEACNKIFVNTRMIQEKQSSFKP